MFRGVGPSCFSISSKPTVRYTSSATHAREWLKPLPSTDSNPRPPGRLPPAVPPRSSLADESRPSISKSRDSSYTRNKRKTIPRSTTSSSRFAEKDFGNRFQREGNTFKQRQAESSTKEGRVLSGTWRQSVRYDGQDRGRFSQEREPPPTWKDETHARRSSEGSRLPRYQRSIPDAPDERSRRAFRPHQETRRNDEGFKGSYQHAAPEHDRRHERPVRVQEHLHPARAGVEKIRDPRFVRAHTPFRPEHPAEVPVVRPEDAVRYFEANVTDWASRQGVLKRIVSYGVQEPQALILLKRFARDVGAGALSSDARFYGVDRFGQTHQEDSVDVIYSTIFFSWAARLDELYGVKPETLAHIQSLVEAASRSFPSDEYAPARRLRRKVIMHVGPTNSGKTHHALRALAAANTGVYAGPLRLLAHEIFQRLNSGSIVPLGVDIDPAAPPGPNPAYARPCNLITGEEHRSVGEDVKHLSCTVEILKMSFPWDVAVIDEIQMLGDPDRGPKWTEAVLGVAAKEVHLCGEETVVPVVEALLAHTGDEIEVRRYDRLTTLTVDDNVLDGDLSKIQKGDCIVAFSRSSIFSLKKQVEKATGMRCAVVYGRLPPETRAEQAALFNDTESGYDVIIGSDAIGMGLNLKIKRVIFASTSKFDGKDSVALQVTSVKQIAGRAGRFGLHKGDLGGSTTTILKEDLPHLKYCIAQPYEPLRYAWINQTTEQLSNLLTLLPPSLNQIEHGITAGQYIGLLPSHLRQTSANIYEEACQFIRRHWSDMPIRDKMLLCWAPIAWRDHRLVEIITPILVSHKEQGTVDFFKIVESTSLMKTLEDVEQMIERGDVMAPSVELPSKPTVAAVDTPACSSGASPLPVPASAVKPKLGPGLAQRRAMALDNLVLLESYHKVAVVYMWWSLRLPIVYAEGREVEAIKHRLEKAMNGLLQLMSEGLSFKGVVPLQPKRTADVVVDSDSEVVEALERLG